MVGCLSKLRSLDRQEIGKAESIIEGSRLTQNGSREGMAPHRQERGNCYKFFATGASPLELDATVLNCPMLR